MGMVSIDFAAALAHLMGCLGEPVTVSIGGGTDPGSPPLVAQMSGTLRVVDDQLDKDLPDLDPTLKAVLFGFDEHPCTFALDAMTFTAAHASVDHLEIALGTLAIEVRAGAA